MTKQDIRVLKSNTKGGVQRWKPWPWYWSRIMPLSFDSIERERVNIKTERGAVFSREYVSRMFLYLFVGQIQMLMKSTCISESELGRWM